MVARKKAPKKKAAPGRNGKQQLLPRSHASGAELTTELCSLEVQLRQRKIELEKAQASLELAKGAVKSAEHEVRGIHDAIADAIYDLRQGQGRITFPEPGLAASRDGK